MQNIPAIIYEDEDLMVVDKPAGMIVNRADTSKNVTTLQDWVEGKFPPKADRPLADKVEEERSDFQKRSGIVHRLDKETSGLVIIAKDENTFTALQKQFKDAQVEKTYIALTHGKISPESGEIKLPIGRLPWNKMRFGVFPQGRQSRTLYNVLGYKKFNLDEKKEEDLTLVKVHPKTGRTHQIRVHFQYLKNPIFADALYAGRKTAKSDRKFLSRHFLHAAKISFVHPSTGKKLEVESDLPEELTAFLAKLT